MKAKLITVALGAALLTTGTLAIAHDRDDRHDGDWRRHEWREHQWREHRQPRWHRDWYHYEPRYERHYVPAPDWHYRSSYPYGYTDDGVSIILRGHFN
jgi:hypothetical protein